MPAYKPIAERFAEKFKVNEENGCWEWTGSLDTGGYGMLRRSRERKMIAAHRLSYELHKGDPGRFYVLHECDNPRCVNPEHLRLGTQQENMQDMQRRGRRRGVTGPHGEYHGQSKLTEKDVEKIRRLSASGTRQILLAEEFGVGPEQIRRIVRGIAWAHSKQEN